MMVVLIISHRVMTIPGNGIPGMAGIKHGNRLSMKVVRETSPIRNHLLKCPNRKPNRLEA